MIIVSVLKKEILVLLSPARELVGHTFLIQVPYFVFDNVGPFWTTKSQTTYVGSDWGCYRVHVYIKGKKLVGICLIIAFNKP